MVCGRRLVAWLLLAGAWAAPAAGAQIDAAEAYRELVALEAQAALHAQAGRHDAAIEAHGRAIEAAAGLKRPRLSAALLLRLGTDLLAAQRTQDAVIAFESGIKALAQDPSLNLQPLLARLGRVSKGLPDRQAPVPSDLYSDAADRDLAATENDPGLAVRLLIGIGNSYLRQPQDGPALNAYQLALQRPEIEQLPRLKAHALANSGEVLRRQGRVEAAEQALTAALSLLEQDNSAGESRRALALLAGIQRDQGRAAQAHDSYRRALEQYRRFRDARGEATARAGLGHLWTRESRCDQAVVEYRKAIELARPLRADDILWPAHLGLGRCLRAQGELDAAAQALELSYALVRDRQGELRTDEGKIGLLESAQDLFDELVRVQRDRAATQPAAFARLLELTERARGTALVALMQGWGSGRPEAASLGLPECAALLAPGPGREEVGAPRAQPSPALPPSPRAADLVAQRAAGVNVPPPPLDVTQAAPALPLPTMPPMPNAMAFPRPPFGDSRVLPRDAPPVPALRPAPAALARLIYHVLDDSTLVLLVGAEGRVHGHVARLGREALTQRVRALREALNVDTAARGIRGAGGSVSGSAAALDFDAISGGLFETLVAPLAPHLPRDGAALALEPHDALWLLPFAALRTTDGRWMGERWPLLYAPSGALLDEARRRPTLDRTKGYTGLIVGNPIVAPLAAEVDGMFRIGFEPLPGAEEEARRISAHFPGSRGTLWRGAQADLVGVLREAPSRDIVHLATHGIARSDAPLDSFVVLAPSPCGEQLSARRVMTLALRADLVTLSACQTGLGRIAGEGVLGLARAFVFAGARSVLVSHWSVSDHASTSLMTVFYERFLGQGLDKAEALRQSMAALRQQRGYEHPRYWAPFFLVGAE
jgi:tetratricopeptide (TPR) repeat protein